MKTANELHTALAKLWVDLSEDKVSVDKAYAMQAIAGRVISLKKLELEAQVRQGLAPRIPFLAAPQMVA